MSKKQKIIIELIVLAVVGVLVSLSRAGWQIDKEKKPKSEIAKIEEQFTQPETSTTTKAVDTSNWLTYKNEKYGFEIKYPPDWQTRESPLPVYPDAFSIQVFFDSPSTQKEVTIRVHPDTDEGMIREAVNITSETKVLVSEVEGIKITGIGHKEGLSPITLTLIRKSPYLYVFEGEGDTCNKILSTFVFIESY